MQQQWGMFYKWTAQHLYVILGKQKCLSSLPFSHYPKQTKILVGKKYFIGCHKQTTSGMDKYTKVLQLILPMGIGQRRRDVSNLVTMDKPVQGVLTLQYVLRQLPGDGKDLCSKNHWAEQLR